MKNIMLKDGREAEIEIWGYGELKEYVDSQKLKKDSEFRYPHVKGFRFLSKVAVDNLLYRGDSIFSGKNLTPMEKQEISGLHKKSYVRSLAAVTGDELVGIMVCNWIKDSERAVNLPDCLPFWRYYAEFLNVHADYQNQGVGTFLIKGIDESRFLENRILHLSKYIECGELYAKPVIERELKAGKYALIPNDYSPKIPPKKPGIYDKFGNLKK